MYVHILKQDFLNMITFDRFMIKNCMLTEVLYIEHANLIYPITGQMI